MFGGLDSWMLDFKLADSLADWVTELVGLPGLLEGGLRLVGMLEVGLAYRCSSPFYGWHCENLCSISGWLFVS